MLAFGCFGTEALFFMGSKGDVKHSVCVFFAWHGLESCWCFGLFESDADKTLSSHRSESTFRTVFCLAGVRLLLAFGCFGTEALFFVMASKGDVKHSVCVFFAWHGLESCWCFGLFESDADETLSSHRSESTFRSVFCLAEVRLLLASGCFGTEALFFLIASKGDVKHSVCVFFAWHGLESCWCFGLFESVFCLAWARLMLAFGCFESFLLAEARLRYGFLFVYCGHFLFLEGSVGNVSPVFCLRFRSVFAACRFVVLEAIFFFFFLGSVGNVS